MAKRSEPIVMEYLSYVDKPWRQGTHVGKNLYVQLGDEPSKDDPDIGRIDSDVLAAHVVMVHNHWLTGP